jgi:hypothetical protein
VVNSWGVGGVLFYQNSPIFRHSPYKIRVVKISLFLIRNDFWWKLMGVFSFFWFSLGVFTVGVEMVRM